MAAAQAARSEKASVAAVQEAERLRKVLKLQRRNMADRTAKLEEEFGRTAQLSRNQSITIIPTSPTADGVHVQLPAGSRVSKKVTRGVKSSANTTTYHVHNTYHIHTAAIDDAEISSMVKEDLQQLWASASGVTK